MHYLGNRDILSMTKIGLLCSRRIPANLILPIYDWAIEERDKGTCIISGFHSKIEKDILDFLIKGNQPLILVIARSMYKNWDTRIVDLLNNNRLLIISPFNNIKRPSRAIAKKRNEIIADIADKLYIPYYTPGGLLERIAYEYKSKLL